MVIGGSDDDVVVVFVVVVIVSLIISDEIATTTIDEEVNSLPSLSRLPRRRRRTLVALFPVEGLLGGLFLVGDDDDVTIVVSIISLFIDIVGFCVIMLY